jgi:hypothetical protein
MSVTREYPDYRFSYADANKKFDQKVNDVNKKSDDKLNDANNKSNEKVNDVNIKPVVNDRSSIETKLTNDNYFR